MNRKYEVLLLLKPDLSDEIKTKEINSIEKLLSGKIVKKEDWGIKTLSYKIKKNIKANYLLYYVETLSENILNFKKTISINKNILRTLILKHEKKWPFEYKTSKELVFPERKNKKDFQKNKTEKIEKNK